MRPPQLQYHRCGCDRVDGRLPGCTGCGAMLRVNGGKIAERLLRLVHEYGNCLTMSAPRSVRKRGRTVPLFAQLWPLETVGVARHFVRVFKGGYRDRW
jgi:hypothetical protein